MRLVPASLLVALVTGPALAKFPPTTCETQRDIPEMVDCSLFQLGEALTTLRSRFPQTATQLDLAQATWAGYRDATCHNAADPQDFGRNSGRFWTSLPARRPKPAAAPRSCARCSPIDAERGNHLMNRLLLPALALGLLALPAQSQTPDCGNTMVQSELNICAEMDWQSADADLNRAYTEVMAQMKVTDAGLPPELVGAEAALRTAQRAWIDYRDANCTAAGFKLRGGSAEALVYYGCLRQMTLDRIEELRALVAF